MAFEVERLLLDGFRGVARGFEDKGFGVVGDLFKVFLLFSSFFI